MAKGFKHGAGGAGLNFKVVGNPQPNNPKENTIWIDTDRINNYYFSSTQPENMADYDVWIYAGASSAVAFSATKKNPIMVYPISAKQYVSGALVDKTAKSYQGGKWVEWIPEGVLYRNDIPYTATLEATNYINSGSYSGVSPNLVDNTECLTMSVSGSMKGWTLFSKEIIDFSKYTKMVADVELNSSSSSVTFTIGYTADKKAGYPIVSASIADAKVSATRQTVTLDLSGITTKGYAFASVRTNGVSFATNIYDWHLE